MEDYITVSAKTLDDAITEALVQLGVTSDRLDYIVVEKGSEGFLGIGRKQASPLTPWARPAVPGASTAARRATVPWLSVPWTP